MTPERAAAVARTERDIAERFGHYGLEDPDGKAHALVRHLQREGWRVHPELAAGAPPAPRRAAPEVQAAAVAEGKAAVEAARRARQEREGVEHVPGQLAIGASS